jgi:hypothetical protein
MRRSVNRKSERDPRASGYSRRKGSIRPGVARDKSCGKPVLTECMQTLWKGRDCIVGSWSIPASFYCSVSYRVVPVQHCRSIILIPEHVRPLFALPQPLLLYANDFVLIKTIYWLKPGLPDTCPAERMTWRAHVLTFSQLLSDLQWKRTYPNLSHTFHLISLYSHGSVQF